MTVPVCESGNTTHGAHGRACLLAGNSLSTRRRLLELALAGGDGGFSEPPADGGKSSKLLNEMADEGICNDGASDASDDAGHVAGAQSLSHSTWSAQFREASFVFSQRTSS
jgi:hypothetical protein